MPSQVPDPKRSRPRLPARRAAAFDAPPQEIAGRGEVNGAGVIRTRSVATDAASSTARILSSFSSARRPRSAYGRPNRSYSSSR